MAQVQGSLAISASLINPCKIEAEKRNRERGIRFWLVGANPRVLDMIRRSPLGDALGPDAMHFNLEIAVDRYMESLSFAKNL